MVPGFTGFAGLQMELSRILGRTVDLRTPANLSGYFRDEVLREARLMHAILEIGEAASRTSQASRDRTPGIRWARIVSMRNVLIHVYWGVDFDRLWKTVNEELPALLGMLEAATKERPIEPTS